MSRQTAIAAIGDQDSVMLFKALGVEAIYAMDTQTIEKAIHRLCRAGCSVIYITEQAAALATDAIERYKTEPFPAIIPIPNRSGSNGLGMAGIRSNIEKAIGADILFGEER